MASNSVIPSFPIFNDVDGSPLESGYIYCGDPGFNPEVAPKNIFWDSALTVPAAQPIRTTGGFPSRSGAPAMFYTDGDYSLTVRNKNSSLIYSSLNSTFEIDIDKYADTISIVSRAVYMENTSGVADSLILARPDTTINEVAAYYDGLTILFDTAFTNTGATVANIDGLSVKKVRTASDADLSAGAILAGVSYFMVYNTALDSGAGAFELKDMQPQDTYAKLWDPQSVTHNFTSDADYTLTAAQNLYGRIVLTDTSAFLTTARNVITDNIEKSFIVQNDTLQTITVKTLAGTGISILPGASAYLYNDGTNILSLDTPSKSLSASGYIKLPSGLIVQWGTTPLLATNSSQVVSFPIVFPNACVSVQLTVSDALASNEAIGSSAVFNTANFTQYHYSGTASSRAYTYIAIGY